MDIIIERMSERMSVYNCQAGLGGLFKVIDDGKIGYECEKTNELLTKQIVFVAHNN